MSKKVSTVRNLFDIPYKNVGKIKFKRSGELLEMEINSLNEEQQEELRDAFPQPEAPLKKKPKLTEEGNPVIHTKGPLAGKHITEEYKDYDDKEFIKAYHKHITDSAAGAAAMGLNIAFAKKGEEEDKLTLHDKIARLKQIFNYDSINYIGQEVLKLSSISAQDLEEAEKN